MVLGLSEGWASLHVSFEELVCEVLSEEGKHKIGALWVRNKLPPEQELLHQHLHIRQLFFTCKIPGRRVEANYISKAKATQIHATQTVSKALSLMSVVFFLRYVKSQALIFFKPL